MGRAQILPLLAGWRSGRRARTWADRLARPLGKVAGILLAAIAVLVLVMQGKLLLLVGIGGYVAVVLAAVASILLGHLLGGPRPSTRTALAIACAVRNPGIALLVVQLNFAGRGAGAVVLTYVLVSAVLLAHVREVAGRMRRSRPAWAGRRGGNRRSGPRRRLRPGSCPARTRPWCASTMVREMARPIPSPPGLVVKNGSNILSATPGGSRGRCPRRRARPRPARCDVRITT